MQALQEIYACLNLEVCIEYRWMFISMTIRVKTAYNAVLYEAQKQSPTI